MAGRSQFILSVIVEKVSNFDESNFTWSSTQLRLKFNPTLLKICKVRTLHVNILSMLMYCNCPILCGTTDTNFQECIRKALTYTAIHITLQVKSPCSRWSCTVNCNSDVINFWSRFRDCSVYTDGHVCYFGPSAADILEDSNDLLRLSLCFNSRSVKLTPRNKLKDFM